MRRNLILLFCIFSLSMYGQTAYVVNSGSQTLSRIDLTTHEVDNAFAVLGNSANRVAVTEDYLYVVNSGDNNIQKIDRDTGNTVSNIYIGTTSNPYDIIINEDTAYVTGALSNKVYKVDLLTDSVLEDVSVGGNPAGMAVWGTKLYVGNTDYASDYQNCSVSIIDLEDFSVIGEIPTDPNPQYLLEHNDLIHVSCTGNWSDVFGSVQIIDPGTDGIVETLNIGGYTSSLCAMGNDIIYVGDLMSSGIYAYNSTTFEIIYDSLSPFLPGASTVVSDQTMLAALGGEWGQNFTVNIYGQDEILQHTYYVGLYATDIKISPENGVEAGDNIPANSNMNLTNYPNPFKPAVAGRSPGTTISFQLSEDSDPEDVELVIYNLKGQKIKKFSIAPRSCHPERSRRTGNNNYDITWDGTDQHNNPVCSGIYYACLSIEGKTIIRKMVLLK
jgi:YVTN family beta-propeller protein